MNIPDDTKSQSPDNLPISDLRSMSAQSPIPMIPWQSQSSWNPERWRKEQREREIKEWKSRLKQFGAVCALSLFIYLFLALIVMLTVTPEAMSNLSDERRILFIITPEVKEIVTITGLALVVFFLFLVAVITISFLLTIRRSATTIGREIAKGNPGRHSIMLTIGGLFFAMLFLTTTYYLVIEAGGVEPSVPDYDDPLWSQVYLFAMASVWEEVVARILLIGVPLMAFDIFLNKKRRLPAAKYFLGGGFQFGYIEVGLVLFSAEMFALGHIEGWDFYKVIPSAIAGLCFGYLFLKFGFYAAVVFHFSFNFLRIPIEFFGESSIMIVGLLTLLWLACGAMFFIYYSQKLGSFVSSELLRRSQPQKQG